MFINKSIHATNIETNSYHEYVLNTCIKNSDLYALPNNNFYLTGDKQIKLLSLWLSGYIDRLQYCEYENIDEFLNCVHNIISVVDKHILALKTLINEISNNEFIANIDTERLYVFEKLCEINKELREYVELQEVSSKEDYPKLMDLGGNFLCGLYKIKLLLDSTGIDSSLYTDSIKNLINFLNETSDNFKELLLNEFAGAFVEKNYTPLTALCIGIDFLKYIAEFLDWEIIQIPDCPMESIFQCNVNTLYSLGENFTFKNFQYEYITPDKFMDFDIE